MGAFRLLTTVVVAVFFFALAFYYLEPKVELRDVGEWITVPDDMPQASRNFLCSLTECRYENMKLQYYVPRYVGEISHPEPWKFGGALVAGILVTILAAYFASKLEDMSTKKAIAVIAGVYGAGMTALMLTRKDFRTAAPLLAPLAAALILAAIILWLLLRAAGHDIKLTKSRRN